VSRCNWSPPFKFFLVDICILFVRLDDFDLHHGQPPWRCCESTFPVALYVLLISYFALLLVPFADLLNVLTCLHVVNLANAYMLLTSVIKLTLKLLNIIT
jgi:hypothetical protein